MSEPDKMMKSPAVVVLCLQEVHNLEEGQIQRSGFTALHTYRILSAPPPSPPPLPPAGK